MTWHMALNFTFVFTGLSSVCECFFSPLSFQLLLISKSEAYSAAGTPAGGAPAVNPRESGAGLFGSGGAEADAVAGATLEGADAVAVGGVGGRCPGEDKAAWASGSSERPGSTRDEGFAPQAQSERRTNERRRWNNRACNILETQATAILIPLSDQDAQVYRPARQTRLDGPPAGKRLSHN